ncbi:MAG: hypothetical protein ACR2F8_12330 [Caulobacteraceae bacterium]
MTGAPFTHIGGAVVADHGTIALAQAKSLARFYRREARGAADGRALGWAALCRRRADALQDAIEATARWRRAAGWADPEAADQRPFLVPPHGQ